MQPWTLTIPQALHTRLLGHLFPGDADEHGAVLTAGMVQTSRGTRLLIRDVFLARDGIEFVQGVRGYRRLTAEFVRDRIRECRDDKLIYLAVHNHRGDDEVSFSEPDDRSHQRGYPALLDISGQPVGALVLARNAIAGDIWTTDRQRRTVSEAVVLGQNIRRLHPKPPEPPPQADHIWDRQVRWFGERGQHLLGQLKVGVVGAGGVGLPLITLLGRLGVGELIVIDPDRLSPTNLPRMPEARRSDALMFLRGTRRGERIADRYSIRKIRLARRTARRANPNIRLAGIPLNVADPDAAHALIDCDYSFLAADGHVARMVVNAIAHQYLIPSVQLGTRIEVDRQNGQVGTIRSNVRPIVPGATCLRCNNLISGTRLQDESIGETERSRNRYVEEIPAPSVITFNTSTAAQAATDFLLAMGELLEPSPSTDYLLARPRLRRTEPVLPIPCKPACRDCGLAPESRRARGQSVALPLIER